MPDSEDQASGAPAESPPKPSIFKRKWMIILVVLFLVLGIGFGVICYLSSPTPPRFTIFSIDSENFQASSEWNIGFSVRNSNKVVQFWYEQTNVIIYDVDMNVVLSSARIPPFFLSSRSNSFVVSMSSGPTSETKMNMTVSTRPSSEGEDSDGLIPKYPRGIAAGITVKVDSDVRVSPVMFFFSKRRFVAVCKELLVGENGGGLLNGPKTCSSSISSMWK